MGTSETKLAGPLSGKCQYRKYERSPNKFVLGRNPTRLQKELGERPCWTHQRNFLANLQGLPQQVWQDQADGPGVKPPGDESEMGSIDPHRRLVCPNQ